MEKHWKSVIPKSICDYFFEAQRQVSEHVVYVALLLYCLHPIPKRHVPRCVSRRQLMKMYLRLYRARTTT